MKYLSILRYALIGISILLILLMGIGVFDGGDPDYPNGVGIMLTWSYFLLAVAILTAVFMPLINIIQNPKNAVRSLLGLGIIAVVFIVAFALSSGAPVPLSGTITATPLELKFTDMGLYVTYILLVVAIGSIVLGEVYSWVKK